MRNIILTFCALVAAVAVLAGLALSPLLLTWFAAELKLNTELASQVGGSYGAVSALLSALALCVVALSAILQIRQTRVGQLQASRSLQLELLRMAMEKPEYRGMLGDGFRSLTPTAWREHAYLNLWLMYLQMGYLTGAIGDEGVRRVVSSEMFASARGLEFWERAAASYLAEATGRRHRKFVALVTAAHAEAVALRAVAAAPETRDTAREPGNAD